MQRRPRAGGVSGGDGGGGAQVCAGGQPRTVRIETQDEERIQHRTS
ncbi:hypothetical protein E2C01_094581 [Portunus trituberculatus]|uniref:Uncharacterized protein n=1 Tax=Portunus trituberculatus TaxID=210409 RepID=A0A5B7JXK5_PORTR|nr:hypothetical protein [Portunus trituberculatus]